MKIKRILKKTPLLLTLNAFLMLSVVIFPMMNNAKASDDTAYSPKFFINPPVYVATAQGDIFTVEVKIANVSNLVGVQFKLGYNTMILDALEVAEGSFLGSFGSTMHIIPEINETNGFISAAIVLVGTTSAEGEGILATVTFECTDIGECVFGLYDTKLIDPTPKPIDHYVTDGYSVNEFVDPPSVYITDTMDTNWDMRSQMGSDGYVDYGYSTDVHTSTPTSILAYIWGSGTTGQDTATIWINKTFPWEPHVALKRLRLNYLIDEMTDDDAWGGMAVLTWVQVITHDATGKHEYSYIIAGATTNANDWSYDHCRDRGPNVKYIKWTNEETPAPGHGELEPPTDVWYTLDRDVDADFTVDWSTVTDIEIMLVHGGGYLHADHFKAYFDDLELQGQSRPYGPIAKFTVTPIPAAIDESIKFDASSSSPGWDNTNEIPITEYRWDFGDGNQTTTSAPIVYHSFSSSGIYLVALTVYAPSAIPETDSTTHIITVEAPYPPVASFSCTPIIPAINEIVIFDASSSTPDGGTITNYEWDFGDGENATGQIVTHVYCCPDVYTVRLNVTDSEGLWDLEQLQIQVVSTIPCDLNGDGVVNLLDWQILSDAFGSYPGHPRWDPRADLNNDGIVELMDFYLFSACAAIHETVPPDTEISLDGVLGTCGWYISDVTVTLTASDWISGVNKTEYSFNEATWIDYTGPFMIVNEGITSIYYRSTDNAGNLEQTKSQIIRIDKTAPEITITSPEPRDYLETETLTINYGATDAVSGIASVNATLGYDPATIYVNPQISNAPVGGDFSIEIWLDASIDNVTNLYGWQIRFGYNTTILDATNVGLVPGNPFEGKSVMFPPPIIDDLNGFVMAFCVVIDIGDVVNVTDSKPLVYINFTCTTLGSSDLEFLGLGIFGGTNLVDNTGTWLPLEAVNGYFASALPPEEHDIAVTSVVVSATKVTSGNPVELTVVVENQGTRTETFDVTVFYDSNVIATTAQILLGMESNVTLNFTWNTAGVDLGAYLIKAEASVVPGEVETIDNTFINGIVVVRIPVYSGQTFDLSTFKLGTYTLTVTAIDNACNEDVESITFTVVTTVSGVVSDEYTKEPIQGVTISIFETDESTVTEADGRYSLIIRSPGIYTVEMTVPYGYLTHDDVTKFVEVIEAAEANFTLYQASWSGATVPRTIGYWKNWENHYTLEMMETFISNVKDTSGLFNELTVDDVKSCFKMGGFSMEQKGQAQLLASWLSVVSVQLGLDVQVDLSSIEGWEQVITIPDGSVLTVDELLRQIDNLYLTDADLTQEQWEIIKDILDALNNGQLLLEE